MFCLNKILIADFDEKFCTRLKCALKKNGYKILIANSAEQTVAKISTLNPDIVFLDIKILLSNKVLDKLIYVKKYLDMPFIVLSEKTTLFNKDFILKFCFVDSFMLKPVRIAEILFKLKIIGKTISYKKNNKLNIIDKHGVKLDINNYELYLDGKKVKTTPKELELLYKLMSNENKLFTRAKLLEEVWGYEYVGSSRTIDVHIKRLREKLKNTPTKSFEIKTVWGVGYIFKTNC